MMTSFFQLIAQTPAAGGAVVDLTTRKDDIAAITNFNTSLEGFMRGLLLVGALAAFAYMLWGAMDWILSQGEQSKIESARKKMTHALIGLALLASVGAVFLIIQSFLGINILKPGITEFSGNSGAPNLCKNVTCGAADQICDPSTGTCVTRL